jgi:drug/metabolite transporter (DMT)-like permease
MQNRVMPGIISLCIGVAVFSLQDALIKAISGSYPVTEALAIRALVAMPILLALVGYEAGFGALVSKRMGFLTARAAILFASYTAYYLAIAALPMAEAVALYYMAPLVIMVLAGPYLGERVRWRTLAVALVGLAGVLVMLRPGDGLFDWAALLSLMSAFLYGCAQLMARKMGGAVTASVMTFYQNGFYLVGSLVLTGVFALTGAESVSHPSLLFLMRPWQWPAASDFLMMAACGVIAAVGMMLLSQAYRLAPANRIATFEYTGIVWTPLWGFLFFAEIPQAATVAGAALIVGAGLVALNMRSGRALPQDNPAALA